MDSASLPGKPRKTQAVWATLVMQKLLKKLEDKPQCVSFTAPPPRETELSGQPAKPPMTLRTVQGRLDAGAYTFEDEADTGTVPGNFAVDVRSVFENAMQSNSAGTATHHNADFLRAFFDRTVAKFEEKRAQCRPGAVLALADRPAAAAAATPAAAASSSSPAPRPRKSSAVPAESGPAETIVNVRPGPDGSVSFRVQLAGGPGEAWVEASHFPSEPRVSSVLSKVRP